MRLFVIGHTWDAPLQAQPRLLSTYYGYRRLPGKIIRHQLPVWALAYSFLGGVRVRVRSARAVWQVRQPHSAHLYQAGICFWEDSSALHPPRSLSAYITFLGGEQARLMPLVTRRGYAQFSDPEGCLAELLKQIAEIGQSAGEKGFYQAQARFWQILDLLAHSQPEADDVRRIGSSRQPGTVSALVRRVDEFLEHHLHEKVSRKAIADHLHVSLSSLAHRYRRENGLAPMTRLIQRRISRAKQLLLQGEPLKQIAEETGFTDAFHLSRTFKRLEGVSPRLFLDRCRQG